MITANRDEQLRTMLIKLTALQTNKDLGAYNDLATVLLPDIIDLLTYIVHFLHTKPVDTNNEKAQEH